MRVSIIGISDHAKSLELTAHCSSRDAGKHCYQMTNADRVSQ